MMNTQRVKKIVMFLFFNISIVNLFSIREANAEFITELTVSVTRDSDLNFVYSYSLMNLDNSTFLASALSIAVPLDASITDVATPDGWNVFYSPEASDEIVWETGDSLALLYPGDSLSFSFKSKISPGVSIYNINGTDDEFQSSSVVRGSITGPGVSAVPEPSSIIPLGTGLITVACYAQHRRRRSVR